MSQGSTRRALFLLSVAALSLVGAVPARRAKPMATPASSPATPFDAPLARPPLAPPLVVTGGFGEYRVGHFHAGFDFGTNKRVGQPVFAPLAGHVERIRASGVGYGRSIYLRTRDGRLLQFGHLDAYAEPMASWVRNVQDSSGVYEQDLWPEATRFPVQVGQRIAWTGESGAGGPHMHFEIRRGDMAYHPQLAGLKVKDDRAPSITSVTLEPLDDTSYVERSAGPVTRNLGARPETLRVIGRVRAIVAARDGAWSGVDRMVPWLTRMEWTGQWIECRMDSISWATDMSEGDYVYDAGRVVGDKGIVLWASRGFRPRFIRSSAALTQEAGTIRVRAGDAPLTVKLEARDVAGNVGRRTVVIRPGSSAWDPKRPWGKMDVLAALPDRYMRFRMAQEGAPKFGVIRTEDGQAMAEVTGVVAMTRALYEQKEPIPFSLELPQSARFDSSSYLVVGTVKRTAVIFPKKPDELSSGVSLFTVLPETEPLRAPMKLRLAASKGPHSGIYRLDDDGWSWVGDTRKGTQYELESRRLGWFAEFVDTLAPRITLRSPPRTAAQGPYNRWAVEAGITEKGSGVAARASYMVVDGKKVAAEWDPEADALRWRPLERPAAGTHKYDVIVEDRAGNQSVRSGTFVLD